VLLDDSRRYVERAVAAGIDARLDVWMGMPHGFAGSIGQLKASARALDAIAAFLADAFRGKIRCGLQETNLDPSPGRRPRP
jgi:acetyl esterase/lipase